MTDLESRSAINAISVDDVSEAVARIRSYVQPYRGLLVRREQGEHLERMVIGLTSNLERKSVEPIAVMHGIPRRGLQRFVGDNGWSEAPLLTRQLEEISCEIGLSNGSVIVDGSATPKKGVETVGVARQWCGRLGKVDNCVVGVHAAYVGKDDAAALVASELFLPRGWCGDKERRAEAYVPEDVEYRSQAKIAAGIIASLVASGLPFKWVLGDDEFGRARHFRDAVANAGKSYVLDVPCNTVVCRVTKYGWVKDRDWTVDRITKRTRDEKWISFMVRDGEKGPIEVRAFSLDVATRRAGGEWAGEILVVIETLDGSQRWYCLSRSREPVPLSELVRQAGLRHRIEEVFAECKGEIGLDHFEVRAWHGWYHHMALAQIAHWFLVREKRRLGKKDIGVTVSQIRMMVAALLVPAPTAQSAARLVNYHRNRNHRSRCDHYRARGVPPPEPIRRPCAPQAQAAQ